MQVGGSILNSYNEQDELKKLIDENRKIREAAEKKAVEQLKAAMGADDILYCADCGQPVEGEPIIWMGTSPRCESCHKKRME